MWCTQCTTSGKSGRGDAHVVHPVHYIGEIRPGRRPCGAPSALHQGNPGGETPMWCTQRTTSGESGRGDAHVVHPAHYIGGIRPGRRPCGAPNALHREIRRNRQKPTKRRKCKKQGSSPSADRNPLTGRPPRPARCLRCANLTMLRQPCYARRPRLRRGPSHPNANPAAPTLKKSARYTPAAASAAGWRGRECPAAPDSPRCRRGSCAARGIFSDR